MFISCTLLLRYVTEKNYKFWSSLWWELLFTWVLQWSAWKLLATRYKIYTGLFQMKGKALEYDQYLPKKVYQGFPKVVGKQRTNTILSIYRTKGITAWQSGYLYHSVLSMIIITTIPFWISQHRDHLVLKSYLLVLKHHLFLPGLSYIFGGNYSYHLLHIKHIWKHLNIQQYERDISW